MAKLNDEEKQIRQNDILNFILNYPREYSIEEIAEIFDISSKTIRSTYGEIYKSQGVIGGTSKQKYGAEKIEKQIETIRQISFSKEEIKKCYIIFIITCVYKGKVLYDELVRALLNSYLYEANEIDNEVQGIVNSIKDNKKVKMHDKYIKKLNELKQKLEAENKILDDIDLFDVIKKDVFKNKKLYIKKLLNELKEANLINVESNYVQVVLGNKLSQIDEYKLHEFLIYLNILKEIHPKMSIYKRLFSKLSILCTSFRDNIVNVDKLNGLSIFDELKVEAIREAIYKKQCINFYYRSSNNSEWIEQESIIPLGIIYNYYKDQWYLSAYSGRGKRQEERLYRLDKVINIDILDEEGTGNFDKEKFEDAIGINAGKVQEIEVHFDNEEFVKRKVQVYCRERKLGKLYEENNKLVLRDEISGITEFETWVRGFGKSAKCIKPEALVRRINENINKLKGRYEIYE